MSQSFMSGMLGFDDLDNGECDETTEEDLRNLPGADLDFDLPQKIKEFLQNQLALHPTYMDHCIQKLPAKDIKILKNDFNLSL